MDREQMSKKVRVWLLERNALFGRTRDEADWLADHITDFAIEVGALDGWVAVSEGLPERDDDYDVTWFNGRKYQAMEASFEDGIWYQRGETPADVAGYIQLPVPIIAWRERPAPFSPAPDDCMTDAEMDALIDRVMPLPAPDDGGTKL